MIFRITHNGPDPRQFVGENLRGRCSLASSGPFGSTSLNEIGHFIKLVEKIYYARTKHLNFGGHLSFERKDRHAVNAYFLVIIR